MTTHRFFFPLSGLILSQCLLPMLSVASAPTPPPKPIVPQLAQSQLATTYGKLPLSFEANQGQTDAQVQFLARGNGYTLFLTPTESVMVLRKAKAEVEVKGENASRDTLHDSRQYEQTVLRMRLEGANAHPQITGAEKLPGIVNYFIGNDPAKWRTKIPTYAKVHYKEAYPGIDLAYYGNQGKLEYDLIVAPGADPNRIKLAFEGASDIKIADSGDLLLTTALGEVRLQKPVVYQLNDDGHKKLIAGQYVVHSESHSKTLHASRMTRPLIGVQVAAYDVSSPLIIDPTLFYSTYLGGSDDELGFPQDMKFGIAADAVGNAYLTGRTTSPDFPTPVGAFQTVQAGLMDIFVTKLNPTGSGLVYSTYLGGAGNDQSFDIAVDTGGNAYVAGDTQSFDFPRTPGAFRTFSGPDGVDGFVTKLNPTGSALVYSTFTGMAQAWGIAIAAGHAYVAGLSGSLFPTTLGAFDTTANGSFDAVVSKLDPSGSALVYSTFLGGSSGDIALDIAVDAAGNAYVTGDTDSLNFPTANPIQPGMLGGRDVFVTKLDPSGSALVYSTYLGGSGLDRAWGIAVDALSNAYVTGYTHSVDFPTTTGGFQTMFGAIEDAFVTKLNPSGSALVYSTYLGGSGNDKAYGIAVDAAGSAYVSGGTGSGTGGTTNFPTVAPFQAGTAGGEDVFVSKLNDTGSALVFSTYYGGNTHDRAFGIALDPFGNAYVMGATVSGDFPTTPGAFQTNFDGGLRDTFVAKIQFAIAVTIDIKPGSFPNSINLGSSGTVPVAILSTATFDATTVDPLTVTLASAPVKLKGKGTPMASVQDVNGDTLFDLVVHVDTQALALNESDTEAVLEGQTFSAQAIRGTDSIRVVP